MAIPLGWLIASVAVTPSCLVLAFVVGWLWWRRARLRLVPPPPQPPLQLAQHDTEQGYKVLFPSTEPLHPHPQQPDPPSPSSPRLVRSPRSSTLSIHTTLTLDGARVLQRRSRSDEGHGPTSGAVGGSRSASRSLSLSVEALQGSRDELAQSEIATATRRDGVDLARRDWSGEFDEIAAAVEVDEEEQTEELAASTAADAPESAEWMSPSFLRPVVTSAAVGEAEKDRRMKRSTFSAPSTETVFVSSPVDTASGFFPVVQPAMSGSTPRRMPHRPPFPPALSSQPSSSTLVPADFSSVPYPLTRSPPTSFIRTPTRSAPTLLETALLRSVSSPELRTSHKRLSTDPLLPFHVLPSSTAAGGPGSSADLYSYPPPPRSPGGEAFFTPSSSLLPPIPTSSPGWPPSPPHTPKSPVPPSPSHASPALTDFPVPTVPRPPRSARPPGVRLQSSTRSLPSSSFHGSASEHDPAPPLPSSPAGTSPRWSFRRPRLSNTPSSPSLSWSGSWGRSPARDAGGGGGRRVSRELLRPLRASVRAETSQETIVPPSPASPAGGKGREGGEGRGRAGSVGTLESHVARRLEGVGKLGGVEGVLTLTNPDPTTASSGRPSTSTSRSFSVRTSIRLSFETAPVAQRSP